MRLIDADKLMELARNHVGRTVDCNDIARFPTVDAVPVVQATREVFNENGTGSYRCSQCGVVHYGGSTGLMRYCSHCGARFAEVKYEAD